MVSTDNDNDNDNVNDNEMKKLFWVAILLAGLFSLPLLTRADDYIDDVYYSPEVVITTPSEQPRRPYYNKSQMKEIIFLDNDKDTVAGQMPDTVRASNETHFKFHIASGDNDLRSASNVV